MNADTAGDAPDALDLVRAAAAGAIPPPVLAARLRDWVFVPRRREYVDDPREFFTPNSLDAVDLAYFDFGLLTDDEYTAIIRTAVVRERPADLRPFDHHEGR